LIDGKHLFREPNVLIWAVDRGVIRMYAPISLNNVADMIKLAEVTAVNLVD